MNDTPETPADTEKNWGPYQLRPNPMAILRLSLGTAAAISTALLIPDIFALMPNSHDALTLACKAVGLWGYAYVLWAAGFLCILHLVRIFGGCIELDAEGILMGHSFESLIRLISAWLVFDVKAINRAELSAKIPWKSIVAVTVTQRKIFSRLFFVPSYQMMIHVARPDGKLAVRQLASFQYQPEEFYSLFYYIAKFSTGARPQSIDAFVFRDVAMPGLGEVAATGRLKNLVLTVVIAVGLFSFLSRNASKNYAFNMGNREFGAANYDRAVGHYSVATSIDFAFAPAWDRLARSEFRLGDLDEAEKDWQTALKWKPDYVESKLGLSAIYMLKGKLEEAEKLISSANRLAPLDEAAYINRAQIDILTGKSRLAIKRLQRFVAQKEGREQALCLLARAYIREGQLDKAKAILQPVERLLANPYTRPFCTMVLAELNLAEGNTEAATKLLKSIRLAASHQPDVLIDMARLDMLHKDFVSAKRHLSASCAINPDSPWLALARAELSDRTNSKDMDSWLNKAIGFRYQDPALMSACAEFLRKQGRKREAVELAKKVLELDPDNLTAAGIISFKLGAQSDE
jgi:tetratricopeptide (TPR) repeat protein